MLMVENLHKRYPLNKKERRKVGSKWQQVLSGVSFSCAPGSVTGLLGVNGAGKTTTLRTLTGAISPDSGRILVDDREQDGSGIISRMIGFHSSSTALYKRLSVMDNLMFYARVYGLTKTQAGERVAQLAEQLGFGSFLHKKVRDLSTGMHQKAAVARAIIHDPQLLILDEPTSGMDVKASVNLMDFIRSEQTRGKTVLFSTHNMHEVEQLCDGIILLHNGQTAYNGAVEEFCRGSSLTRRIVERTLEAA